MTAPIEVRPACGKAAISTETLRTNLGLVVGQLQALHRCVSQARHRLTGAETPGLRLHLDGVVWTVHHATGTIAERLRALDTGADRLAVTAATTAAIHDRSTGEAISGAALPIVIREILAVVDTIGPIRALLDATDLSTAELLGAMSDVLREQASTLQRESVERRVSPPNPAPAPVAVNPYTWEKSP
jgi:DNA-binding ferritin-like protein